VAGSDQLLTQNQSQLHPRRETVPRLYEVVLLDKKIKIKISNKIEKEDRDKIKERLNAAIAKINAGADKLTTEEKKTINSMNGIEVRTDISYSFTNTNNKVFNMMPSSVMVGSLDSLTGAIIHDSYHSDQARRGLSFEGNETFEKRETKHTRLLLTSRKKLGSILRPSNGVGKTQKCIE